MEEQQVGIEEYTTRTTGFTGILKHRYNDFQVFEVDLTGRTAHLTSTQAPQSQGPAASSSAAALSDESVSAVVLAFEAVAGHANAAQLQKLLSNIQQQQQQQQQQQLGGAEQQQEPRAVLELEVDLLPEANKDKRKAIHQFLKSDPRLPPLATDSVAAEGAVAGPDGQVPHHVIRVRSAAGGSRGRQRAGAQDKSSQKRGKREWRAEPAWEGGDLKLVKFVMLKENMDTQAALGVIARMLHCQPRSFGFAGTKDKRGVTTQWVTLWKVAPAKLAALNSRLRGIKLGNFEFTGSQLSLGQLKGNTFRVLMRDISTHDEQHVSSAVSELRERGFINYFGLQRFGTGAVPTHRVGGALLRGEWQQAVQLIMQGGPEERQEYRQARALYLEKGDIEGALKALPTFLVAERAVLQGLAKCGANAHLAALQGIPRTLRSMYLHAWQSWLWNRAASERIRRYRADRVVPGDLVLLTAEQQQQAPGSGVEAAAAAAAHGGSSDANAAPAGNSTSAAEAVAATHGGLAALDELYGQEEHAAAEQAPIGGDDQLDEDTSAASAAARLSSVHTVTEADAAEGRFSMQDVVLPLPGSRVLYPQHAAGWQFYCQMAAADGVMLPGMTAAEFVAAAAAAKEAAAGGTEAAAGVPGDGCCSRDSSSSAAVPAGHNAQDFKLSGLSGDYRKLLHVPVGMTHTMIRYTNPDADLLPSDWNEVEQQQQQQQSPQSGRPTKRQKCQEDQQQQQQQQQQQESEHEVAAQQMQAEQQQQLQAHRANQQQQQDTDVAASVAAAGSSGDAAGPAPVTDCCKEMVGVVLDFTLPPSCYATMLVRELTKSSTSKASHKEMSTRG